MTGEFFLARTEEQDKFKQVLGQYHKSWIDVLNSPIDLRSQQEILPNILLFHGQGGMGKTRLVQRLREIVDEKPYKNKFQTLFLNWERKRENYPELQVGHDNISPETVLKVLHDALADGKRGKHFQDYRDTVAKLRQAENKVDAALKKPPAENQPNKLIPEVTKWGARGIALILRSQGVNVPESALQKGLTVSAEAVHQVKEFTQRNLEAEEYDIYTQPHEKLAKALGKGMAKAAQNKPLVIFLDTYEIIDRPECDYTLRTVIQHSGKTVWAIAGRENLADSGKRGKIYFRGYKGDFTEKQVYAKGLSEFGVREIAEYFAKIVPQQPLNEEQIQRLAEFSLGIPFVINQAASMLQEKKPFEEIVAPPERAILGEITAYQRVINATCDRFLVHCVGQQEQDLQAVYALGIMRRPEVNLLQEMLEMKDVGEVLQSLKQRYSFILVEQIRLDEKLGNFLKEDLLSPLRRDKIQPLINRAILWLELRLEELTANITDTAAWLENERIAEVLIDLVYYRFWQGEEKGWRALIPRFVEGWQYNRFWTRRLLEVVETFYSKFTPEEQQRFQLLGRVLEDVSRIEDMEKFLETLEKEPHCKYLEDSEHRAILQFIGANISYLQEKYRDALQRCLEIERQLPEEAEQFKKDLAEAFYALSGKFIFPPNFRDAVYSPEGETAIEKAVALNPRQAKFHSYLGINYRKNKQYKKAITAYEKALEIDPKYAYPHNNLGWIYLLKDELSQAKDCFKQAITLDSNFRSPFFNLGLIYALQNNLKEAKNHWKKGIELCQTDEPQNQAFHALYTVALGETETGITTLKQVIKDHPNAVGTFHDALGDAEVLNRCPVPPPGIDRVIKILKEAIDNC